MIPRSYRRTHLDRVMDTIGMLAIGGLAGIGFWAVMVGVLSLLPGPTVTVDLPAPLVAELRVVAP